MENLKIPERIGKDVYTKIKDNKTKDENKETLESLQPYVLGRYKIYEDNTLTLEIIENEQKITEHEKQVLLDCYTRTGYLESKVIKPLKSAQKPNFRTRCPYCRVGTAKTIDHYLPKDEFPEFAILPINLIPCCSDCNSKKGEKWKKDGRRRFINFYFDSIPKEQFLFAKIEYDIGDIENTTNIKYYIDTKDINNEYIGDIIKSHFSLLQLQETYTEVVVEELSNIYTDITTPDRSIEECIKTCEDRARTLEKNSGKNFWETILYRTILESDYIKDVYEKITKNNQ